MSESIQNTNNNQLNQNLEVDSYDDIRDIVKTGSGEIKTFHRPDGKLLSRHELELIQAHQDTIRRGDIDSGSQPPINSEPSPPTELSNISALEEFTQSMRGMTGDMPVRKYYNPDVVGPYRPGKDIFDINQENANNPESLSRLTSFYISEGDIPEVAIKKAKGYLSKYKSEAPQSKNTEKVENPENRQSLKTRFSKVEGVINSDGNRFFIAGEIADTNIELDLAEQYWSVEPFFTKINIGGEGRLSYATNERVVPWAWELGDNERFVGGEAYTNGDSGLFGLCSASAETTDDQAELYKVLSEAIVNIHKNSGGELLKNWMQNQLDSNGQPLSSLDIFGLYDSVDGNIRPFDERLVIVGSSSESFIDVWNQRLSELGDALNDSEVNFNHLRWLEFLSHSVDVEKIIETVQNSKKISSSRTDEQSRHLADEDLSYAERAPERDKPKIAKKVEEDHAKAMLENEEFERLKRSRSKK